MSDFKNYRYIGMPFHAVGFPQPVYSHLMGSNDGINWADLKTYNFGWRDTSLAYINGEFWTCTGTYVNHTKDFEEFTQVQCPNMGLKNLWASEFFQDNNNQWWFVYCGSETDVDYSEFKLYASKMFPSEYKIDGTRYDISLNVPGGYIDPNINYINGKYYLWCSKTSSPTQELHLFKSTNILGPYDEVKTNIMSLVNQIGFTWDEAPEMIIDNGKYYLYSDPWNHGDDESKRDVYRAESTDLINWTNIQRCNANCTIRHFTPLKQRFSVNINFWDGNPGSLNIINQNNFEQVQNIIIKLNELSKIYPNANIYKIDLDTQLLALMNREAHLQFITNVNAVNKLFQKIKQDFCLINIEIPKITNKLTFVKDDINNYWKIIQTNLNKLNEYINEMEGED
nr:hypothetical protein [uncultured Ligilactobacillus sp.]